MFLLQDDLLDLYDLTTTEFGGQIQKNVLDLSCSIVCVER